MFPAQSNVWRKCRRIFRWFRITCLLGIFGGLCALFYLTRIGLPTFIKAPVLAELRSRGLNLKFSRMRLHVYRGIVAENVRFGRIDEVQGPQFFVKEVAVRLDNARLLKGEIQLRSLLLRQGNLTWLLEEPNQPSQQIRVNDILTELRFLPNDQMELDAFQASWLGTKIKLSGTLTNASLVQSWKMGSQNDQLSPSLQLRQLLTTFENVQFPEPPEIKILAHADGRQMRAFSADVFVHSVGASTPWGTAGDLFMTGRWLPFGGTNSAAHVQVNLKAAAFDSEWGKFQPVRFAGQFSFIPTNATLKEGAWQLEVADAKTPWGKARDVEISAKMRPGLDLPDAGRLETDLQVRANEIETKWARANEGEATLMLDNSATSWTPLTARGQLTLREIRTDEGQAGTLHLTATVRSASPDSFKTSSKDWGWWKKLEPYDIDWQAELEGVASTRLQLETVQCSGQWHPPALNLSKLQVGLYGKQAEARARLNVSNRELQGQVTLNFDLHQIAPLLPTNTQQWLQKYTWETSPQVEAQARMILPAWTNPQLDWQRGVLPTLWLDGNFQAGSGSFRTIPVVAARSHFSFSNLVWRLPDLIVDRPEGRVQLDVLHSSRTEEYRIDVRGRVDPKALIPLLEQTNTNVWDFFELGAPAVFEGSVWGPWSGDSGAIEGRIAVTNFIVRGEHVDDLETRIRYTNGLVEISDMLIHKDEKSLTVPKASYGIGERVFLFTNIQSTLDPMVVARAIGPKAATTIAPYHFEGAPAVTVNGSLALRDSPLANLTFDITGGPFRWYSLNLPKIGGTVHWHEDLLNISNLQGAFYGGQIAGLAHLDFTPASGTEVNFQARAADVDLHLLMRDLAPETNKLEGTLRYDLVITSGNTKNLQNWQGQGSAKLSDGLLWDIPAFGMFSPLLNAISPGLGNSRAEEASATFIITNSMIVTKDLEIRASAMRLQYRGTVDLEGNVNARAEAKLFHDAKGVGPLVGLMLMPLTKIFEYKVTGTLGHPKKQPLFIPKLFMIPFHPVRSLKELLSTLEENVPAKSPSPKPPATQSAPP
jgi:hypothetical protein